MRSEHDKRPNLSERLNIAISPSGKKRAYAEATTRNVSVSELVRMALDTLPSAAAKNAEGNLG